MTPRFDIRQPGEEAYVRRGLFAIELLDPVTLERVSDGVRITADGLRGKPYVNSGGMFVWLDEDLSRLTRVSIDPRSLPYERVELQRGQLNLPPAAAPVTTVSLFPRVDYPFSAGITAARGTLIGDRFGPPVPVASAEVHLRWLDDDGVTWRDAPTVSRTNARGDFVVVMRPAAIAVPQVDATGALTVRLIASRDGIGERVSLDVKLPQGRVADPSTLPVLIFAWDELQP
jgi:hypothetical protein